MRAATTAICRRIVLGSAALTAAASLTHADVLEVVAVQDNTLYEEATGLISNGSGDHFFTGRNGLGLHRRGVVAFDLTGIPPGSTVNSVTLTAYLSKAQGGPHDTSVHLCLADWGEAGSDAALEEGQGDFAQTGDATWIHTFHDTVFWATAGGDFVASPSATTSVGTIGTVTWSSAQMMSDVQAWVDNPATNYGWLVMGDESAISTSKRFDTKDNVTTPKQPTLTIDFTASAATGACCFDDGSCQSLSAGDCANQGGTFQGVGVSCGAANCQPVTGACCFSDGTCTDLTAVDCANQGGTYSGNGTTCATTVCPVVLTPFLDPLPIPSVAVPITGVAGGEATYEIEMNQFTQKLHKDLPPTLLWGYESQYPGPTIEAAVGEQVTVEWKNELRDSGGAYLTEHHLDVDLCPHGAADEPKTVVHLHGAHTYAEYDGYPEDDYLPGNSLVYEYPNFQLPATLWYHDHGLGITRLNVYMGLAAFYLIRDAREVGLGLPSGEYEIPLAIQDRSFNADGSLQYPSTWQAHFFGNTMLVNGKVWPYLDVKQGKYRFRVLNGCNSRFLNLSLDDGATFELIGTDGGLLENPITLSDITLSPAERADIVIDFESYAPGTEILLVNDAPSPYPGQPGVGVVPNVMKFVVQGTAGHTDRIPSVLRTFDAIPESESVQSRDFRLAKTTDPCTGEAWLINGLGWDDITEFPQLGTTEIWRFINDTGITHPMHMHLVMFQVLDRTPYVDVGGVVTPTGPPVPPLPEESGWKDTVMAHPGEIVRVIARFEDYTGKFPYHCHILEHEDEEMMRQFEVVPGPDVTPYGCGVNPAGSLTVLSGTPAVGQTLTLGVDNPLGTQASGSLPIVGVSVFPQPTFPCGLPIPGWGMGGLGSVGELLINIVAPDPIATVTGPAWTGPGSPAPVDLVFPTSPGFIGLRLYAQALLADLSFFPNAYLAVTEGLILDVGP